MAEPIMMLYWMWTWVGHHQCWPLLDYTSCWTCLGMSCAGPYLPSNLPLCVRISGHQSNTWFLGVTRVHIPNGIMIGSAVFAQLTALSYSRLCQACKREHCASLVSKQW